MKGHVTTIILSLSLCVYISTACQTRYSWKEAWTNSCNGKTLTYNAMSTFKGMGKWIMEQKENGVWVEVGKPSFNECHSSSEWYWEGVPSDKLHVTSGGTTKSMVGHFDQPSGGNSYDITIAPTGNSKKQKYTAPDDTVGELISTPGVKVTINP